MTVAILILAAGASSRMRGKDKLLEIAHGKPLLRLVAERALEVSGEVIVTLPPVSNRLDVLDGLAISAVTVEPPEDGMSASIRVGVQALSECAKGVMILPADMPDLDASDLGNVIQAFVNNREITRGATYDQRPGHPVVFPRRDFEKLCGLSGDQGAREILKDQPIELVPLPGEHALTDLDTPEDWDRWR